MRKEICPRCEHELCFDKDEVSDGYYACCLRCDEDFYKIEVTEKGE